MANRYVRSGGNNANNGTTHALAWATIEYAVESGSLSSGDIVWIKRDVGLESPASDVILGYNGAINNPISVIGWPRNSVTGTGTFTNGSTNVSSVSIDASPYQTDREKHMARRIKNDSDGQWYLITRIPDTSSFTIDREYQGTTDAAAAFTIQADEDYAGRPSEGSSNGWDDDADDLPGFNFGANVYGITNEKDAWVFKNLEFKDGQDANGAFYQRGRGTEMTPVVAFIGCLFSRTHNSRILTGTASPWATCSTIYLERVIITGSGLGNNQSGVETFDAGQGQMVSWHLRDCAVYNCGAQGIIGYFANVLLENVNVGVEQANGSGDLYPTSSSKIIGKDVKLGGTNGELTRWETIADGGVYIENYNKELGKPKAWFANGEWEGVTAGTLGVPAQRTSPETGSDTLIQVLPNIDMVCLQYWKRVTPIFVHEYEVDTQQKSWRYYICSDIALNQSGTYELWLELEYVSKYDDNSEYITERVLANDTINVSSDFTDYYGYLEVSNISPIVASKLRIKCFISKYDASNKIWIDPKVYHP